MKIHTEPPDLEMASRYLETLTNRNGWQMPVHFAVLPDRREMWRRHECFHTFYAPLIDMLEELTYWNHRGCGVFVVVQGMRLDLEGDKVLRTSDQVETARAVFIDWDQAEFHQTFAVPPTMTVKTANGIHAYWGLTDAEPSDIPPTLRSLVAYYGSDPSCTDLARVLRLPGFFHCKGKPTMTELTFADRDLRYTVDEIVAAHPVELRTVQPPVLTLPTDQEAKRYRNWASCKELTKGGRHSRAYGIAMEGFKRGLSDAVVSDVVRDYCLRGGLTERDVRSVMTSATRAYQRSA